MCSSGSINNSLIVIKVFLTQFMIHTHNNTKPTSTFTLLLLCAYLVVVILTVCQRKTENPPGLQNLFMLAFGQEDYVLWK